MPVQAQLLGLRYKKNILFRKMSYYEFIWKYMAPYLHKEALWNDTP